MGGEEVVLVHDETSACGCSMLTMVRWWVGVLLWLGLCDTYAPARPLPSFRALLLWEWLSVEVAEVCVRVVSVSMEAVGHRLR